MDIDEFLDRELSGLGFGTDKAEDMNNQDSREGTMPPLDAFKAVASRDLEKAEEDYVQLWHALMQQKLRWNKDIYEQLAALSRQFSSVLSQARSEVKAKADSIYSLISRAKAALKEGRKDVPFKIYSEVQEMNNTIPNVFFEEKKAIQDKILSFYNELRSKTDNDLIGRTSALAQEINRLIESINAAISSGNITGAIEDYSKCIELYIQVPEGFLHYKNSAGIGLLEIYKTLSIYNEISALHKQLGQRPLAKQPAQGTVPSAALSAKSSITGNAGLQSGQQGIVRTGVSASSTKDILLAKKKDRAKRNMGKGYYNEASKDIEEALQIEPADAESKALRAKIRTLS